MSYVLYDGENREKWLESRKLGVCASEVPILFGEGYGDSSILNLYLAKTGDAPQIEETEVMKLGRRLESATIEEVAERAGLGEHGAGWCRNKALFGNYDHPFMFATPDGVTSAEEPIEVKNICHGLDDSEWDGTIPPKFMLQVQAQIAVLGANRGLFGALLLGGKIVWDWIPRDNETIALIDCRVREFWARVLMDDPPSPGGTRSDRNAALKIAETLKPVELFESEVNGILDTWEKAKAQEDSAKLALGIAEAKRKAAENELILRMGGASKACTVSGWKFEKTTTQRNGYTVEPTTITGFRVKPPRV